MDSLFLIGAGGFWLGALAVILFCLSFFLVFIIMMQRGKGGGIAGSLTGTAQSAFGARGGDQLMWTTIAFTGVWIFLSCVTIYSYSSPKDVDQSQQDEGGLSDSDTASAEDSSTEDFTLDAVNELPVNLDSGDVADSTTADESTSDSSDADIPISVAPPQEETEKPTVPASEEDSTEVETPDSK